MKNDSPTDWMVTADCHDTAAIAPPKIAGSVVIAVPSADCYPQSLLKPEHRSLPKRAMLAYQLEESLPFDADDLAIDSIASKSGWLTIAVNGAAFTGKIDELEEQGVYVRAIVPTLILALTNLRRSHNLKRVDTLFWQSDEGIDVVSLTSGVPFAWSWLAATKACVEQWHASSGPDCGSILAIDCDDEINLFLTGELDATCLEVHRDVAAAKQSKRIASGRAQPVIDLRNGLLESRQPLRPFRRSLSAFVFCFILLQAACIAALLLRDQQYRSDAAKLVQQQESLFHEVFPAERVPVGIVSRLHSEHRSLVGSRGVAGTDIPQLQSVIPMTHRVLSTLPQPQDARFTLQWLDVLPDRIEMNGEARSYADLELIAGRMKRGGLAVPPLSATQTANGVTLRFDEIKRRAKQAKADSKPKRESI